MRLSANESQVLASYDGHVTLYCKTISVRIYLIVSHVLPFIRVAIMTYQTIGIAIAAVVFFFAVRYLNRTDTPKVKNLPEIPGVPLFGNLLQFGSNHARVAGNLAKRYGPVFQVRLGNRVCMAAA